MKLSIVIPCYKSGKNLIHVVDHMAEVLESKKITDYEFVLVNDCSGDDTFSVIRAIAEKHANITGLDLAKNTGQHNAIMAGFRYVTGDYVMICSDDGQTPIEVADEMIRMLDDGKDAVCIRYEGREGRSLFRKLGTKVNGMFEKWLTSPPENVDFCIDMMVKRFVVDELIRYEGPFSYMGGMLYRTTKNIGNVSAVQHERTAGQSGYTIKKLIKLWMDGFTAFSVKPLRVSAFTGGMLICVSVIMMLVALVRKIIGAAMFGSAFFLAAVMFFCTGLLLVFLGLVGEYVGRIYLYLNKTPQYVIRERVLSDYISSGEK